MSTASAVAIAITVVAAWLGTALSAALTLGTTTALTAAALGTALSTATLMPAASATTGPRFAARVPLPLSAFCRAHERNRRDDHDCCDEEGFDAHTC